MSEIQIAVYMGAVAFAAAILLLDVYNISMPRGDSIGVSGSLVRPVFSVLVPGGGWSPALPASASSKPQSNCVAAMAHSMRSG